MTRLGVITEWSELGAGAQPEGGSVDEVAEDGWCGGDAHSACAHSSADGDSADCGKAGGDSGGAEPWDAEPWDAERADRGDASGGVLSGTPDHHDGTWLWVTRYGSWVTDVRTAAELEQYVLLAGLVQDDEGLIPAA